MGSTISSVGTIAFTDRVAHEWFAPAGLNRGGLTTVTEEADSFNTPKEILCMTRINPIPFH